MEGEGHQRAAREEDAHHTCVESSSVFHTWLKSIFCLQTSLPPLFHATNARTAHTVIILSRANRFGVGGYRHNRARGPPRSPTRVAAGWRPNERSPTMHTLMAACDLKSYPHRKYRVQLEEKLRIEPKIASKLGTCGVHDLPRSSNGCVSVRSFLCTDHAMSSARAD